MKHSMNDLAAYRMHRAKESLAEAIILAENNHWNTVANRLYYAAYYSLSALFILKGIKGITHSGVKIQFHKEFIKTGILDKEMGKLYNNLFNKRHEGDYEDFQDFKGKPLNLL
jgi:uncharacterized protein